MEKMKNISWLNYVRQTIENADTKHEIIITAAFCV